MDNDLGGVGGISRLCQAVYNLWASAHSRWGRDYVRQFFLLVKIYESCSQIRTPTVRQKVQRWTFEAEQLVQRMEAIRSKRTKEEAQQLAELICKQMMGIIDDLGLDPAEDGSVGTRWKKAKKDSKALDEAMKRLPSASDSNTDASARNAQAATSLLTLKVNISPISDGPEHILGPLETRTLAFPAQFANYSLCPLIFYSLTHPEDRAGANISPLTIHAMDTVYLRYLQSTDDPAIWGPVDPCSPVTLSQYHKKKPQAEVRFVRGKIRFLLVSTYHSGIPSERVFDLDSSDQRRRLVEVLVQGSFDAKISSSATASATPSEGSKSQSLPDGTAFENIIPRTCFVVKQPNLYESFHPMHPSVNDLSFIV